MGWVKLDDGFPQHPKVIMLSLEAKWAYIESLCYAARYETDGKIPEVVSAKGPVRAELMASGLWESLENSVYIHDFLAYNPSRSEREQKRNRSRTFRASREGGGTGPGLGDLGLGGVQGGDFGAFWAAYPRKVGKPKARAAFEQALRKVSAEVIIAGAERYRDDPNRSDEYTAHPTTWLHRDGWDDAALPTRTQSQSRHPLDRAMRASLQMGGGDGASPGSEVRLGAVRSLPG